MNLGRVILFCMLIVVSGRSEEVGTETASNEWQTTAQDTAKSPLPQGALRTIELLDFKNSDLRDVVRAIGDKYKLNIFVDDGIAPRITMHLVDIPVIEALNFIAQNNNLELQQTGAIFRFRTPEIPEVIPEPLDVTFDNGLLSLNLRDADLREAVETISKVSGQNVVLNRGVTGTVSGYLQNLLLDNALHTLFAVNGYALREKDGVYIVDNVPFESADGKQSVTNGAIGNGKTMWVNARDSLVSLDVAGADVGHVLREMFTQAEHDLIVYDDVKGEITARCSNIEFERAVGLILRGTKFTYRREREVYVIGGATLQGISSSELIRLCHLKVEEVMNLLPERILKEASIKLVKEHNGFIILGPQETIRETHEFLREVDRPVPQVLIEALVVDFNRDKLGELSVEAGVGGQPDTTGSVFNWLFPDVDVAYDGFEINAALSKNPLGFGLARIAKLPDNFYLRIKAMEEEKRANVRSRPQIATLNGHTASISIGTTQYYKLKSTTPIQSTIQTQFLESDRFETIKAEMKLEVTPWVTAAGEIITEVHPEFSTPKGSLNSDIPPTIDHRILDSTIKLKDGETIVLGGLIQEFDSETIRKFPILGSLPLIGRLFQNRSHSKTKAELMIYLTPHVYYLDEERSVPRGRVE